MECLCAELAGVEERDPQACEDEEHGDDIEGVAWCSEDVKDAMLRGVVVAVVRFESGTVARETLDQDGVEADDATHDPERVAHAQSIDGMARDAGEQHPACRCAAACYTQRNHA